MSTSCKAVLTKLVVFLWGCIHPLVNQFILLRVRVILFESTQQSTSEKVIEYNANQIFLANEQNTSWAQ